MASPITLAEVLEESPVNVNLLLAGVSAGEAGAVMLQQHISKHTKLQILELRGSTVGPSGCSRIAKALHEHPCIRHVGLARNGLDMSSCVELINALSTCRMLQSLDLEWDSIDDQCAAVLAKWLNQLDCTLVALNLERNFISKSGALQLSNAIANNKSLKNLNIGHMRCETEAAVAWGNMLSRNNTLETLNMSGSELLTDGTKSIILGLKNNHSLRSLSLQYCQGLTALGEIAGEMQFDICLKDLNLQGSRAAPNETLAKGFGAAIQKATGLIGLNMSRCVVSDAAMNGMLNQGVSLVMSLQVLDISACGVSDESMLSMVKVLDRCINLHTLAMDDNHLGPRGAQILAEGLVKATALTTLSISSCDLRNAGVTAISNALRKRTQLSCLKISNNSFDIDGGKALIQALLEKPEYNILRELDVSQNRLTARFAALLGLLFKRHKNLMPICVRGTTISQAVQEAYVDATSIRLSAEAQRRTQDEMMQQQQKQQQDMQHHNDIDDNTLAMLLDLDSSNLDLNSLLNNSQNVSMSSQQQQQQNEMGGGGGGQSVFQQYQTQEENLRTSALRFQQQRAVGQHGSPSSSQYRQKQYLVTNFNGASPETRALPPSVGSKPNQVTQQAIRNHKQDGSWFDNDFGEAVNSILNSTTNFRSSSINKLADESKEHGDVSKSNNKLTVSSTSPSRIRRADLLSGAISAGGATGTFGYGETYRLNDADVPGAGIVGASATTENEGEELTTFQGRNLPGAAIKAISSLADNNNNSKSDQNSYTRQQATRELLSPQSLKTSATIGNNTTSDKPGGALVAQESSLASPTSALAPTTSSSPQQKSKQALNRHHHHHSGAGGFLYSAGLAPRTEPSPMWARRPQMFDLEASVGESLCVSEPQLKLAFMELDKDKTGLVSRRDVEFVYQKFCIDYDPKVDTRKLDNFFIKYARGKKDGKIGYDAFCMLMLSLVNR